MLNYSLLATVSSSTFAVQDIDIEFSSTPDKYAYYYVKAYNSNKDTYSDRTNIVDAAGEYNPAKRSVKEEISQKREFSLSHNFPNPFNPVTQIKYSLAQDADVTIKVYDMLGREVDDLVNELKQEGSYEINFSSEGLSSGVYIYRIITNKNGRILFTDTKQMILMK